MRDDAVPDALGHHHVRMPALLEPQEAGWRADLSGLGPFAAQPFDPRRHRLIVYGVRTANPAYDHRDPRGHGGDPSLPPVPMRRVQYSHREAEDVRAMHVPFDCPVGAVLEWHLHVVARATPGAVGT